MELKTVNHRYLEFQTRIPEDLRALEPAMREAVAARLTRGKVDCRITFTPASAAQRSLGPRRGRDGARSPRRRASVLERFPGARALSVAEVLHWPGAEPSAGSDASGTQTRAVFDGQWILDGSKTFTTNAHYADVCVAMAVTDRAAAQHGISAFIVERGTPGFRAGKKENKLGLRASATGEVIFENCRLARAQLLGKVGEGFVDSLKVLDGGRISIAALSIGMAQGAYDAALSYSKLRKQFGRPISEFQAIQHKLVDMAVRFDAARLLNLPRRLDARSGAARHARIGDGEAVRVRGRRAHRERGGADPRRLRLHQGLSRGEVLSRRQALHHRRRHQRDPALVIARQLLSPQDQLTVACS